LTTATISGPPDTLRLIAEEHTVFGKAYKQSIPVRAPYHAPHIYNTSELSHLIPQKSAKVLRQYKFNTSRAIAFGKIDSTNTLDLFRDCIHQMLRERLTWAHVLEDCARSIPPRNSRFLPMGSSNHLNGLLTFLKQRLPHLKVEGQTSSHYPNDVCQDFPSPDSCDTSKIAVVGMAGRFPNAVNHNELWSLLEKGLDVNRTVGSLKEPLSMNANGDI